MILPFGGETIKGCVQIPKQLKLPPIQCCFESRELWCHAGIKNIPELWEEDAWKRRYARNEEHIRTPEQEETLDISRGTSRHPRDSFSYAVNRVCNVQFLNCNLAFIFLNSAVLHDLEAGETIREGKRVWEQCEESGPAALHQLCPLCTAIYIFILRATKSRQGGKGEEEGQLPKCTIVRTPTH